MNINSDLKKKDNRLAVKNLQAPSKDNQAKEITQKT